MVGFKIPCRYCSTLVEPTDSVCPSCSRVNPAGPLRCPACRNPVQRDWASCSGCGLGLTGPCPVCGHDTFRGEDYCSHCDARLVVVCPHDKCKVEQPALGSGTCIDCGKPLDG